MQDGNQLIDAAYEVFIQGAAAEELKYYICELRTKAMLYLEPARIREYMKIIADKDCKQTCQEVMEYIVVVLGQFLQIMVYLHFTYVCFKNESSAPFFVQVHFYISSDRPDMVTVQFEKFNANFKKLEVVFKEVTGRTFKPGQVLSVMENRNGQVRKCLLEHS